MARRRRRRSRGRRGGGFSGYLPTILVIALVIGTLTVVSKQCELFENGCPKPVVDQSELDVFVLDATSHEKASHITNAKILSRLQNPFGTFKVEGKSIPGNSSSVPAEVTVIVISSQTNINYKLNLVTVDDVKNVWGKIVGSAIYDRASMIYNVTMSPQSPIWQEVTRTYFNFDDASSAITPKPVSECISDLANTAATQRKRSKSFADSVGYLEQESSGGETGAWETLCNFGSSVRANFDSINATLDSAKDQCTDSKCSDIPGATQVLANIIQEKSNWVNAADAKKIQRKSLVCAYFGTDMATHSNEYLDGSHLDLLNMIHNRSFPKDSFESASYGTESAQKIIAMNAPSVVLVKTYVPMIGNNRNTHSKTFDANARRFLTDYWTAYFNSAFNSQLEEASTGCEGEEWIREGN